MPRPPFTLTDSQAATIAHGVRDLESQIKLDPRSHRPFVKAFIALVHNATGKLFSPEIYRRLLDAYCPQRRPSIATIASERANAGHLAMAAPRDDAGHFVPQSQAIDVATVRDVVADVIRHQLADVLERVEQSHNAQVEFYQFQLEQSELALKAARALSLRDTAELAALRQSAQQFKAEVEAARVTLEQQAKTIDLMANSTDEMRKFSLMSIEESRGETRLWKARCAELELRQQRDAQALDALRQANFRAASLLPASQGKP